MVPRNVPAEPKIIIIITIMWTENVDRKILSYPRRKIYIAQNHTLSSAQHTTKLLRITTTTDCHSELPERRRVRYRYPTLAAIASNTSSSSSTDLPAEYSACVCRHRWRIFHTNRHSCHAVGKSGIFCLRLHVTYGIFNLSFSYTYM